MIVIGTVEPYKSITANKMELFNEAFVLISTYHLYEFTPYLADVETQEIVGKSLVYLTTFNVLINLVVAALPTVFSLSRKFKLNWKRNQAIKKYKKN